MALYEVHHHSALNYNEIKGVKFAKAITRIHCERFSVPAMFVTVRLRVYSGGADFSQEFVGGIREMDRKHRCCRIIAYLPASHYHSDEDYNEHMADLKREWNEIINSDLRPNQSRKDLRSIHIVRTTAVLDMGIVGPKAEEGAGARLAKNLQGLESRAQLGDKDCQLVMNECRKRSDLRLLIRDSGEEEALPAYEPRQSSSSEKQLGDSDIYG
ncbi:hypothetical protein MMC30_002823 [Trapelia coarctata]|nr:hypothetical protein [Trapelia coarctata]